MRPVIILPRDLAKKRFTSKVQKKRNYELFEALRANQKSITNALDYLATGFKISTACGTLLDAHGEDFGIPRNGLNDEQYREILSRYSNVYESKQSRPAIGEYLAQNYPVSWLTTTRAAIGTGAVGALFNRAPLGRMIYAQLGGTAPNFVIPEIAVSATLNIDVYSTATPPSVKITSHSPMMPGNVFQTFWGGLRYFRTISTIRAGAGITLRAKGKKALWTGYNSDKIIVDPPIVPQNTFATVKAAEIVENG